MPTPSEELAQLQQQYDRLDQEALLDLLDASRERTIRGLRQALRKLRALNEATAAAHKRLATHLGLATHSTD